MIALNGSPCAVAFSLVSTGIETHNWVFILTHIYMNR